MIELLLEIFPNIKHYTQLLPVCFVGIFAGIVNYLQVEKTECALDDRHNIKATIKTIITSTFLTLLTYSILTATDLPYLACVGVSAAVGYFGFDKAIELVQKIIALRGSK